MLTRKLSWLTSVSNFSVSEASTALKISGLVRAGYCVSISSTPSRSSTLTGSLSLSRRRCSRSSIWASATLLSASCFIATEVSTFWNPLVSSVSREKT